MGFAAFGVGRRADYSDAQRTDAKTKVCGAYDSCGKA